MEIEVKWDLESVESFIINQVEENIKLDYKAADALQKGEGKKKEISKDISAMANAAGGIIIYGIREYTTPDKRHLPEKIDPIIRADFSKEWLEQVINTNIQPKIEGIVITPVTVDTKAGTAVYVVEIPQSNTAHQANDKRYYKRYNFESVAMEDYEVRDIMSRVKHPLIDLEFTIVKKEQVERDPFTGKPKTSMLPNADFATWLPQQNFTPKKWMEYRLKIYMKNNGRIYANYVNFYLHLPSDIIHNDETTVSNSPLGNGYKVLYGENTIRDVVDVKAQVFNKTYYNYGPSRFDPILPGMRSSVKTILLKNDLKIGDQKLAWTIHADNAEVRKGTILLSEIQIKGEASS